MEEMTRHQKKMLKKQDQEKAQVAEGGMHIHKKHVIGLLIVVALVGGIAYGWRYLKATTPDAPYTKGPVHWHAKMEIEVCGEKRDLPGSPSDSSGISHGKSRIGTELTHHHFDNVMHIEGVILKKEDIALGAYADRIGLTFDREHLMEKKSGDECSPGKPGQVKMFVNGEQNEEFRDFIPKEVQNPSDQVVRIIFE